MSRNLAVFGGITSRSFVIVDEIQDDLLYLFFADQRCVNAQLFLKCCVPRTVLMGDEVFARTPGGRDPHLRKVDIHPTRCPNQYPRLR